MGYRFDSAPPPKPDNLVPSFHVYNGSTASWSFPCYYLEVEPPIDWHDYRIHDFHGWPNPSHPDHICQMLPGCGYPLSPASVWRYIDMSKAIPIHLTSEYEGYDNLGSVVFDQYNGEGEAIDLTGVAADICIRPEPDDWIVDLFFDLSLPPFADKPKEFNFNSYFKMTADHESGIYHNDHFDVFLRGKLVVLPGPQHNNLT